MPCANRKGRLGGNPDRGSHLHRLAAGRVAMKGQKGIRIVAPDEIDDGKVRSIKPVYVFDVTQTQERTQRAAT